MIIRGEYYDGRQAASRKQAFRLDTDGYLTALPGETPKYHLKDVNISRRIGNIPRNLGFPDGTMLATSDHELLDEWLSSHGGKTSWVHRLESNLRFALAAVAAVAVLVTGFAIWGIPWVSARLAYAFPPSVNNYIGQGTLETLDRRVFSPTSLDPDRRHRLQEEFAQLTPRDTPEQAYRLIFRHGGIIGANAFALPDGTVVVTDELVKLARNDEEILAVLLHEIGHVVHRHSLRQVISHSSLVALTTVITGDVNSAGALIVALPNVLVNSSYSRALETEADSYSLEHMRESGIPLTRFADFMERLEHCSAVLADDKNHPAEAGNAGAEPDCSVVEEDSADGTEQRYSWFHYLSTHPPSAERIARFREAAR